MVLTSLPKLKAGRSTGGLAQCDRLTLNLRLGPPQIAADLSLNVATTALNPTGELEGTIRVRQYLACMMSAKTSVEYFKVMEENNILPECSDNDVVSFRGKLFKVSQLRKMMGHTMTEQNQLNHTLSNALRQKGIELGLTDTKEFLNQGVKGEILKITGKGWQKGKIKMKISLEFIPDVSEEGLWSSGEQQQPMQEGGDRPLEETDYSRGMPQAEQNGRRQRYPR
ncbi:KGK domain-containing protein [Oscillatoria acuminata]|uniref:KGK domain protein n=1 Tax=Oscillatoria acuminata PCC 6304 TaxID=56110 RepID=K9TRF6_9CYAN|nr:KGK domain-containing protein [Oscillatoria acuminata]AFY84741.1 KGK domain protein [Oscillatoria acuminata PCC 6304]